MSLLQIIRFQEQMYYISVVAELLNISYFLGLIFNVEMPNGFNISYLLFNGLYGIYMILIILFTRGSFRFSALFIFFMGILRSNFWKGIPILCILDSIVCIVVLVINHKFIYEILKEVETQKIDLSKSKSKSKERS